MPNLPSSNGPLAPLIPSWQRHLRAGNRSPDTLATYTYAVTRLDTWLAASGVTDPTQVKREHIESWVVSLLESSSPSTASNRLRGAKGFLKWLHAEGEIPSDPAAGMPNPTIPDDPVDVISTEDVKKILATCDATFEGVRDRAMLMVLYDTGCRLGGLVGLTLEGLDMDDQSALVVEKGSKARRIPFGIKTAVALDRYLRLRRKHKFGHLTEVWVHRKGAMKRSGVQTMIRRRAQIAGVAHTHPHAFRHTAAHEMKMAGASDDVLMELFGWKSAEMAARYGKSAAAARAREAHRKLSPGDRL